MHFINLFCGNSAFSLTVQINKCSIVFIPVPGIESISMYTQGINYQLCVTMRKLI